MNEADTRAELIEKGLRKAGWGVAEGSRITREYPVSIGKLDGAGRRGAAKRADFVLIHKNRKLAVVEAKSCKTEAAEGVTQAKWHAERLGVRFTYATNGEQIYQIDTQTGKEGAVGAYPEPEKLWNLTFGKANFWREKFAEIAYEDKSGSHPARYYQENAIDKVMEAIANGQRRILLTLATGTGKTFIAFQIAWKLFQSRWNLSGEPTRRPRILFLADRNILANQAYNAFSAFPEDAMTRIDPGSIRKKGAVPKNANLFFTIFQTFMSGPKNTEYFGEYPKDFFDFIVIDECHRGGANDEGNWRKIMEYFSPAVQLGLTATPKREENADTYKYFGNPVYVYSLKDGINDGYLTPFRVRQFDTTIDEYLYKSDDVVEEGEIDPSKRYTEADFNRSIEIRQREEYRVKLFMDEIDQEEKTLVFCASQGHAALIRDIINQTKKSKDPSYCHRVTANDGDIGEQYLRAFQDNEKLIPTILTTSKKLSTGVDARNVRNIVLLRPVNNMIEFKQIIGRGTRLFEGKDFFTIYDFVEAYRNFNDPGWEPKDGLEDEEDETEEKERKKRKSRVRKPVPERPQKVKVRLADGKERLIQSMSETSYWSVDGKPLSAQEFLKSLYGALPSLIQDMATLRKLWSAPDTRKRLLLGLEEKGFGEQAMAEMQKLIMAEKSDLFDVLAYVAFTTPPVTREKRATHAKKMVQADISDQQKAFLDFVLEHYVNQGVKELDDEKLAPLMELKYGSIRDALDKLGQVADVRKLFLGFQPYLYQPAVAA
jgi:type I restriction enzyme R subunit